MAWKQVGRPQHFHSSNERMTERSQKEVFLGGEGDAWYGRNEQHLRQPGPDIVLDTLEEMRIAPKSVLEIGCADGYRVAQICERFGGTGFGIEPSSKAVADGRSRYPSLSLEVGTADILPFADGQFDLVIFGFCLYLVDPRLHLRCVAEADRVLGEGGLLVIYDFIEPAPYYNEYAHRPGIRSHKMEFSRFFLASPGYRLLRRNMALSERGIAKPDQSVGVDVLVKNYATAFPPNPFV
ncbi:class I SAM-dependent methyltransferase [Bradyrhizobium sp.]|uniref:class I SAM-dependent methyltransferase n=1 Tax=Bradyrhizobium sp. TaxID=376 RepID=UPI003C708CE1